MFSAKSEALSQVPGVTKNAALFLSSLQEIISKCYAEDVKGKKLTCSLDMAQYLSQIIGGLAYEVFAVLCLGTRGKVKSTNMVSISLRSVVDDISKTPSIFVVLAHNHPSYNIKPSQSDYTFYEQICHLLSGLGITVLDTMVISKTKACCIDSINQETKEVRWKIVDLVENSEIQKLTDDANTAQSISSCQLPKKANNENISNIRQDSRVVTPNSFCTQTTEQQRMNDVQCQENSNAVNEEENNANETQRDTSTVANVICPFKNQEEAKLYWPNRRKLTLSEQKNLFSIGIQLSKEMLFVETRLGRKAKEQGVDINNYQPYKLIF